MPDNLNNADLNQLVIELGRSFLQYVGQCWPWTELDAQAERETINTLMARQQTHVASLTDFLIRRGEAADFGTFPMAYTDLHYVSLDYLLAELIENEQALVAGLEGAHKSSANDPEAACLLDGMLAGERDNLKQLQDLAASRPAARLS